MTTEDYVSFEVAKLLKEKGFDENTPVTYFIGDDKPRGCVEGEMVYHKKSESDIHLIACPTLQMAMKWLREVHSYNIEIDTLGMMELNNLSWRSSVYYLVNENECYCEHGFDSYEEACEAAIKYCLENLI